MKKNSFYQRCYAKLCTVPRGRVTTYAALARSLGSRAYRAVGGAMHTNPHAPRVPCHRVVKSDGSLGGYAGGLKAKIRLLQKEGVAVRQGRVVDFKKKFFSPKRG